LHETNEAADPLDSVMTWILLSAAERHTHMTGGIHLLKHHTSHPYASAQSSAAPPCADQTHKYIIHLGWLSQHTYTKTK